MDTDENLGTNGSPIRRNGVIVGYINTSEYGSRMMYFGGAELNTGDGGFVVARTVSDLLNKRPGYGTHRYRKGACPAAREAPHH